MRAVDDEFGVNGDEDLNKISVEELQRKKELMSEAFNKSLLRPGDAGYIYDKEVQFEPPPDAQSLWDDDDEHKSVDKICSTQSPVVSIEAIDDVKVPVIEQKTPESLTALKSTNEELEEPKLKPKDSKDEDAYESISEEFESEELPSETRKDLSKEYDFKMDDQEDDEKAAEPDDDDDFWKF